MKKLFAQFHKQKAFTLIELLVVIVIIATLAVTVFVALNPAQRISDARDARRTSDVDSILTAIHEYIVDTAGLFPSNMPALGTTAQLGSAGSGCATHGTTACGSAAVCANLMTGIGNLTAYLASMPSDPNGADVSLGERGYSVVRDANGIITITACLTEGAPIIQSSR